jgi:hypothetical protein
MALKAVFFDYSRLHGTCSNNIRNLLDAMTLTDSSCLLLFILLNILEYDAAGNALLWPSAVSTGSGTTCTSE